MFRNEKFQNVIATIMLTCFSTTTIVTSAAAAEGLPLAPKVGPDLREWVPLQRRETGAEANKAMLPLDKAGLPLGKGQHRVPNKSAARATVDASDAYVGALAHLDDLARNPARRTAASHGNALRMQYQNVARQSAPAKAAFAATETYLKSAGLPAEIIERNRAAAAEFSARDAELRVAMTALDAAAGGKGDISAASELVTHLLERHRGKPGRVAPASSVLPWGHGKAKARPVALSERAHESLFPRSVQLASAGSLSGIKLPEAILGPVPVPGDLAATDEVQLTSEIRALAANLANNPVQIYNWVRNNVRYTPGYGVMQGSAATLQGRAGNAFDTASLLIALNRAAGIPSRFVYGTVEVPVTRMQSWLGVQDPAAVQALLTAAGIPNKATEAGGKIDAIQFEHVWVQAYADFTPSRGAVNKAAANWVPQDASFKLQQEKAPLDIRGAVNLNDAALFDAVKVGATCSATEALGLNLPALQNAYNEFQNRLNGYLAQQGEDLSVGDVLGGRTLVAENYGVLLGTLPYKTVATGAIVNTLPSSLRWQFRFLLFSDVIAKSEGRSTAELRGSFAALGNKRITLSFTAATEADASVLAAYMPKAHQDGSAVQPEEFPADLPAYLIRLKAELRADGELIASGGSFIPGAELQATVSAYEPATDAWRDRDIVVHAGDYQALALDAQGVSPARLTALQARLAATSAKISARQTAQLSRDDVSGDILYQTALGFFATADANAAVFQRSAGVVAQRLPSYGRAVAPVRPQMLFGTINRVAFPGVVLDIDRMDSAVAALPGGINSANFQRQSNQRDASYARLVLSKLFTSAEHPAKSVSAVSAIASAASGGKVIHSVTSANLATVLPQLGLSGDTQAAVEGAVGAGYRVLVPQSPVSVGAWVGEALQIEDLASGAGAYELHDEFGVSTANLFPAEGMGWLALANPFQSAAAIAPSMASGQSVDEVLASTLGFATTRWTYFGGKADMANGLFLARLAASQGGQLCDSVVSILAANLNTATGYDGPAGTPVVAPVITSAPVSAATVGEGYNYAASAIDPHALPLTWRLVEAPGGMSVGSGGLVTWARPVSGTFAVTLRADNGHAYADQRYMVSVSADALPLEVTVGVSPPIVNAGEAVTITVGANGGTTGKVLSLIIDGKSVPMNGGRATVVATVPGAHQIVARATDTGSKIEKSSFYSVRVDGDTTPPSAKIISPSDDAEVTAPVNVVGTATDANLAYYQLLLRPAGDGAWREIARGTSPVNSGVLGQIDPTQVANGIYELALNVVDVNGEKATSVVTLDVYREMKIGQFSLTFEDLNIEASGIPIRLTRTYDTRRKSENLDFGYGWSVDYQNVQVSKNMAIGLQWEVEKRQTALCLVPVGQRKINVTLPNGKVERFRAANSTECTNFVVPPIAVKLLPLPGTTSTLEILNVPGLLAQGSQLYDTEEFEAWNPKQFKLITEDGYEYYLTEGRGIDQIKEPGGSTLTYGSNGIIHSSGRSVLFTRDTNGRITTVADMSGNQLRYSYDSSGNLTSVIDRMGAVSKYSYDRAHSLLEYTDPLGAVTARYIYDSEGRMVASYDADGKAVETIHDVANHREVVRDRRGNSTTYLYNVNGDIVEIEDALHNKTGFSYDGLGNQVTSTDANGAVTTRTFDPISGKQLTEQDPLGHVTTMEYDSATRTQQTKSTDARNFVTRYIYGSLGTRGVVEPLDRATILTMDRGNLSAMSFAGKTTAYAYDEMGNRKAERDASGNTTNFEFDANGNETARTWTYNLKGEITRASSTRKLDVNGRIIEETDSSGNVTKTRYNAGGQVVSMTNPQGRETVYEYNSRGKLVKTTLPDGAVEQIGYDAENNVTSRVDAQGRTLRFEYDALNRLQKTIYPDGTSSSVEYDGAGQIRALVTAKGQRTVHTYDRAGRLESVTDSANRTTKFGYDENGNRTSVTDAQEQTTTFEYDELNRMVSTKTPDGAVAKVEWTARGTKRAETDFGGNPIAYEYDTMDRLEKVTRFIGNLRQDTLYSYDLIGNKIAQTDSNSHTTNWSYDSARRVTSRILPSGASEEFSYDENGSLAKKIDFAGQTTSYTYDNVGRVTLVSRPDNVQIATTYTLSGQIASTNVRGGRGIVNGVTLFSYDANDRVTRQTNPDGTFLAYEYDANGNISARSTQDGTFRYDYDATQRLVTLKDFDGREFKYTYDSNGKAESRTMPNGTTTRYTYDSNGRLILLIHYGSDGRILSGVRYTFKTNGLREIVDEFDRTSVIQGDVISNPARSRQYSYDESNRVIAEQTVARAPAGNRSRIYDYDGVGNLVKKTEVSQNGAEITKYEYDNRDRLVAQTLSPVVGNEVSTLYKWDENGNLKAKKVGTESTVYKWDVENRLIEVASLIDGAPERVVASFEYDVSGNRVKKSVPGGNGEHGYEVRYLVDPSFDYAQVLEEHVYKGGATSTIRNVWGNELASRVVGADRVYYHGDGLESVKAISDDDGELTEEYSYDAYGHLEGGQQGSGANPYLYTGEYADETISLQYHRARWLDASVGRFVSQDTFSGQQQSPITLNKYLYANANPVNSVDRSGNFGLMETSAASNIASMLSNIQINFGLDFGSAALTGENTDPVKVLGFMALGGAGFKLLKLFSSKAKKFFADVKLLNCQTQCISKMDGLAYERYLHEVLGFGKNFRHGGREFDGFIGGTTFQEATYWIEAKSSSVLQGTDPIWIRKLKSDLAGKRKIAEEAGKDFLLISGGPIPADWKIWLEKKGIKFMETLD